MGELLGADTTALDRLAELLGSHARQVHDLHTIAQRAVAELQASWGGPDRSRLSQQWEHQASPRLTAAAASLESCVAQLRAQAAAQRAASSQGGGGVRLLAGPAPIPPEPTASPPEHAAPAVSPPEHAAPTVSPPQDGSPAANASWWRSMSPHQQHQVITDHPDWIGNRDGVASTARDRANRILIAVGRDRLEAERSELEKERSRLGPTRADSSLPGVSATGAGALEQVRDKLASLDAIEATLARPGERQLLVLDLAPERAQAAVAHGNVDTADNVAVFVPGMSANVTGGLRGYDADMGRLQARSELESRRDNPARQATTATVTWIGYQAPQAVLDVRRPDSSATNDHLARAGAAQLAPFLEGIGAAREHDAHLTLLGHSYGSTTAGLALQQQTGVDDVVFFGSPGLGTNHARDLLLAGGHAYYIEARWDAVGDLGILGIDPSHLAGIEHASARASTVVDPATGLTRHLQEVTGHSSYLSADSTSQYNISVVAAGVPDRRVRERRQGFGDILSWPIPGTYR